MCIKKILSAFLILLTACGVTLWGQSRPNETDFLIWTVEGESDGAYQWLETQLEAFRQDYLARTGKRLRISLINYDYEDMRESLLSSDNIRLPDLVLTVNDHVGPLVQGRKILPITTLPGWNASVYLEAPLAGVKLPNNNSLWGAPFSYGNQLMLYYNKKMVPTPPRNTNELAAMAKALTKDEIYGLVFNQTEPFWLVPWLGGFGGKVFQEDGVTPNLDSPAMVGALGLLHQWKFQDQILPLESGYASSETLFMDENAAMLINGDWVISEYALKFGKNLGIAPLPMVSSTNLWPLPYTSGKYFLLTTKNQGNSPRLAVLSQLVQHFASTDSQLSMVRELLRLPVTNQTATIETWVDDPILNRLLQEMKETQKHTTPMPTVHEMRANWDAMRPMMNAVLFDDISPEEAAKEMQRLAEETINATRGD